MAFRTNYLSRKLKRESKKGTPKLSSSSLNFVKNSNKEFIEGYKVSQDSQGNIDEAKLSHMFGLYDKYLTTYFEYYKRSTLDELQDVREHFPNVHFSTEFRIKGRNSYKKKVIKKLSEGYTGKIYDLYGSKIIVNYYLDENGNEVKDEELLTAKTIEIAEFLQKKREFDTGKGICQSETVHAKDYITTPKESGYRSYHVLRHLTFSEDISFYSETQVKTRKMYDDEQYGEKFGHASAYKNNRDSILRNSKNIIDDVPIFLKVYWNQTTRTDDLAPLPFKQCFEKFFNVKFKDYRHLFEEVHPKGPSL